MDVEGLDPFEVAAHAIVGMPLSSGLVVSATTPMPAFRHICGGEPVIKTGVDADHVQSSSRRALEEATCRHQQLVQTLASAVRRFGLQPCFNRYVDLAVLSGCADVLFEVKTTDENNFLDQARAAVGQLLEYRYRLTHSDEGRRVRLVAVLEAVGSRVEEEFARGFLLGVGVELVLWRGRAVGFEGLSGSLPL
jgi:hypothetical protein